MDTATVVTIVVLAVLVLVAVAVVGRVVRRKDDRRRSEQLQERFGPEYERTVREADDRREAERQLQQAAERRDGLDIRPLTSSSRARRTEQWSTVQAMFVDAPVEAVESARSLVLDVMHERGYPTEDTDERARVLAADRADHGDVVENHRGAEAYRERYRSGEGGTEDLRQAFVFYRRLFDALVEDVADATAPGAPRDAADGTAGHDGRDDHTGTVTLDDHDHDHGPTDGRHRADRPHEVDVREADGFAARPTGASASDERR